MMKRMERIIGFIAIVGIVFKLIHLPGGSIISILSLSMLSLFHYIFSFSVLNGIALGDMFNKAAYKHTSILKIVVSIIIGISISLIVMGSLFKIQIWPGADFQLMIGLIVSGTIFPIALFFYFQTKEEFFLRMIRRIAFYGGIGLMLFITPTDSIVDFYYGSNPEYAELYKKSLAEPENEELQKQLKQLRKEIRERDSAEEKGIN